MIGFSLKSAILVVIVTIASVQCDGWFQRCPDPSTIYDIDINAMAGTWYIVKRTETPMMMDSKCERIEFQVAGSNILSSNFSYVNSSCKVTTMQAIQVQDPAEPYQLREVFTENPILEQWYGEMDFKILDIDYSKYALIYSCVAKFFGLKTQEHVTLLVRDPTTPLTAPIEYRVRSLIEALDYTGCEIIDIQQNLDVCNF